MLCTSCKKEIDDHAKFCPHCGTPATAPPMQTAPPAQTDPAPEPEKPPKPKKEKRQKKQKPSDPSVSAPSEKPATNPGAALMTAFLLIELLPYLLRSVLMLVTKTVLPVPVSCLCGIAGFLAAGGILAFFSKRAGGRAPLSAAVLFTSLFAVGRTAVPFILAASESGKTLRAMIVYAAAAAVVLLLTVLLVIPLGTLFISD
ncbi:MAG: zinc ribbon domain-containing protein, partial [Oscillospiraceae bacterium]|nr:zinc ribbon domain-containing protein [Oscillospiraceae bacterium]